MGERTVKIRKTLLDYSKPWKLPNVYLFTANSIVTKNGLVMGAGNALAAKTAYPELPNLIAPKIRQKFYLKFVELEKDQFIGAFQTKIHWKDPSPSEVVKESTRRLYLVARMKPKVIFHLPCPAISHGGMDYEEVYEIIRDLPDNVIIYKN